MNKINPWQKPPLSDWSICGMNHYHVNGEKFLFVSLVKDGKCITEEGKDDEYLWNRLWHKATEAEPKCRLCKNADVHTGGLCIDCAKEHYN